jgi:hypothetical protein
MQALKNAKVHGNLEDDAAEGIRLQAEFEVARQGRRGQA